MARIRAKNTSPELALRRQIWRLGGRFRIHDPGVPGRPDISNQRARLAVFVDGCFWHGCPKHYTAPEARARYWADKVERNQARRREVRALLKAQGWKVLEVWECDLEDNLESVAANVWGLLQGGLRDKR